MFFQDILDKDLQLREEQLLFQYLDVPIEIFNLIKEEIDITFFLNFYYFYDELSETDIYQQMFGKYIYYFHIIQLKLFDYLVINDKFKLNHKDYWITENFENENNTDFTYICNYFKNPLISNYKAMMDLNFKNVYFLMDEKPKIIREYLEKEMVFNKKFFFKSTYRQYLRKKLRKFARYVGKLMLYYRQILHNRYAPNGKGYFEAKDNFYNLTY
jgi:hypothetical protein